MKRIYKYIPIALLGFLLFSCNSKNEKIESIDNYKDSIAKKDATNTYSDTVTENTFFVKIMEMHSNAANWFLDWHVLLQSVKEGTVQLFDRKHNKVYFETNFISPKNILFYEKIDTLNGVTFLEFTKRNLYNNVVGIKGEFPIEEFNVFKNISDSATCKIKLCSSEVTSINGDDVEIYNRKYDEEKFYDGDIVVSFTQAIEMDDLYFIRATIKPKCKFSTGGFCIGYLWFKYNKEGKLLGVYNCVGTYSPLRADISYE